VLAEAFAGGALFSAGLLHLLADAIEELEKLGEYPWAELLCAVGCLSTHGLETITSLLWKAQKDQRVASLSRVPAELVGHAVDAETTDDPSTTHSDDDAPIEIELSARRSSRGKQPPQESREKGQESGETASTTASTNFSCEEMVLLQSTNDHGHAGFGACPSDCDAHRQVAIGLGAAKADRELQLFVAILAHKGVAAFTLGVAWLPYAADRRMYVLIMAWFASVSPVGVAVGIPAEGSLLGGVVTAVSAGTFLYIGLVEACPGVHASWLPGTGAALQILALLLGFGCMAVLARWT